MSLTKLSATWILQITSFKDMQNKNRIKMICNFYKVVSRLENCKNLNDESS